MLESIHRAVSCIKRRIEWIRMPKALKRQVVAHEAGHAFAAWHLKAIVRVREVNVLPIDRFHGYTITSSRSEHLTVDEVFEMMVMSMAGMAGEQLLVGDIHDGGHEDLFQVIAHWLMISCKLTETAAYPIAAGLLADLLGKDETRKAEANEYISPMLSGFFSAAIALLEPRLAALRKLADELQRKKVLKHHDLEYVLGPRSYVTVEELFNSDVDFTA
jgi:ATP-dependent Zn protease